MSDIKQSGTHCHDALLSYLDALYGFAMTLSCDRTTAEDLVQETYTQATLNFDGLKENSNLKGWLFTIMRNLWLKELRHARSGPEFVALDEDNTTRWSLEMSDDPQDLYVRIWEREEIRMALEQLRSDHREVILLCDIEGFSYKEMAEILGCPLGTIMSRLARARASLKRALVARQSSFVKKSIPGRS